MELAIALIYALQDTKAETMEESADEKERLKDIFISKSGVRSPKPRV